MTELPGFDETTYVPAGQFHLRGIEDLVSEFKLQRASTLALVNGIPPTAWPRVGTANGFRTSARALVYIMLGHTAHHCRVLRERYRLPMSNKPRFKEAYPFQNDVLALPVTDLDAASRWYTEHFGMAEVERIDHPVPTVILERDGTRIGFAMNGGDSSQDGAAVLVANIQGIKDELESHGASVANWRVDERDGQKYQVFFVVAPDGLCYYFHEPLAE